MTHLLFFCFFFAMLSRAGSRAEQRQQSRQRQSKGRQRQAKAGKGNSEIGKQRGNKQSKSEKVRGKVMADSNLADSKLHPLHPWGMKPDQRQTGPRAWESP